jgi:hypothetical protein
MDRKNLEDMSKEELIALIVQDVEDSRLREEDVAGTEQALAAETIQADHYAKALAEADKLIYFLQLLRGHAETSEGEHKRVNEARDKAGFTGTELTVALNNHSARKRRREEELSRRAARAAK